MPKKQAISCEVPIVSAANAQGARQLTRYVAICELARLLKTNQAKGAQADYEKN
jgi:hypothetical protein